MERNVSRFLQFWMRGRQQEKREGKVLSRRSHAAFRTFLPRSETLTGGDKHIWGIGRNCKIGLQMIVPWPEKIFAPCNCAPNPPFVPKSVRQHVAGEKQNLKCWYVKCWGSSNIILQISLEVCSNLSFWKRKDMMSLRCNLFGTFWDEKMQFTYISLLSPPLHISHTWYIHFPVLKCKVDLSKYYIKNPLRPFGP